MNREQSLEFAKGEKSKLVFCAIAETVTALAMGVSTPLVSTSVNHSVNKLGVSFEFFCVIMGMTVTTGGIVVGRVIANRLSFYTALRNFLQRFPQYCIAGTPEEFRANVDKYCTQYTKNKRFLRGNKNAIGAIEALEVK